MKRNPKRHSHNQTTTVTTHNSTTIHTSPSTIPSTNTHHHDHHDHHPSPSPSPSPSTIHRHHHHYHHHPFTHHPSPPHRRTHSSIGTPVRRRRRAANPETGGASAKGDPEGVVRSTTFQNVQRSSRTFKNVCGVKKRDQPECMGCTRGMQICAYDAKTSLRHPV